MGMHNALIITSWNRENLDKAYMEARKIFKGHERLVTEILPEEDGFYKTFFILPAFSGEKWDGVGEDYKRRKRLETFLNDLDDVEWINILFGYGCKNGAEIVSRSPTKKELESDKD